MKKNMVSLNLVKNAIRNNKIPLSILKKAIAMEEKYFWDFFDDFEIEFNESQKKFLTNYILEHIDNKDRWLVSVLLEIATLNGWDLPYEDCLRQFHKRSKNNIFVILQLETHFTENLQLYYLDEIKKAMDLVINGDEYYEIAKVGCAFFMFKFTRNPHYLKILLDLLAQNNPEDKLRMKNILSLPYNQKEFLNCKELEKYR